MSNDEKSQRVEKPDVPCKAILLAAIPSLELILSALDIAEWRRWLNLKEMAKGPCWYSDTSVLSRQPHLTRSSQCNPESRPDLASEMSTVKETRWRLHISVVPLALVACTWPVSNMISDTNG